jgi:hypothetical protein
MLMHLNQVLNFIFQLIHGTERFIRPPPETRLNNQVSQPQ